jgi:hypothetical protein
MEHDHEPVRGLPAYLPPGEQILWQGAPAWRGLARRAFHLRKVALYCAAMLLWRGWVELADGASAAGAALAMLKLAPVALAAIAVLAALGWLYARATVYTITSRRVVLRIGVALPITINIPFAIIGSADLRRHGDGTGDLALGLAGSGRIAWLHLWPHARPWHLARPQPMLRALPEAERAAALLAAALAAAEAERAPAAAAAAKAPETGPRALTTAAA